ncbi:MAG: Gfo/Idh/MocA family oxidoreductase [Bacteroidota bacterium]
MTPSEANEPVRIGLVGLGGHGNTIQQACEQASNLDVIAVYDPNKEAAALAATRFGCYNAISFEELIRMDQLEAVVLVTPNHLHRKQVLAALEADLHVFVEKPLASNLDEGMTMISKAEAKGRVLMVGHNMRFWKTARKARACLESGELGQVISTEIHFSAPTGMRLPVDSWRRKPDLVPILPVTQLAIHAFDLVHYLLGYIEEVTAYAQSAITRDDLVDSSCAIFRVSGGSLGTMISNYCTQELFSLRIAGTRGTLQLQPGSFTFTPLAFAEAMPTHPGAPIEVRDEFNGFESYRLIMEAFGEAVAEHTLPETDGWVGLQSLAVVEAMQRSAAASGTPWLVERFKSASLDSAGASTVTL